MFKKRIANFIGNFLPTSAKRLLVVTSIYSKLVGRNKVNEQSLRKLNDVMRLTMKEDNYISLFFPVMLEGVIWGEKNFTKENIKDLIEKIVEETPANLRYEGEEADILKLVNKMFAVR